MEILLAVYIPSKMAEQLLTGDEQIREGRLLQLNLNKCRVEIGCLLLANSGNIIIAKYACSYNYRNAIHMHSWV